MSSPVSGDVRRASNLESGATDQSTPAGALSSDDFLKLITTQLKNQDPMNPVSNAEFTSQLAQIESVRGITKLNSTLDSLSSQLEASRAAQSTTLIGKEVLAPGHDVALADGKAQFGFEVGGSVSRVVVQIIGSNGQAVRTLEQRDPAPGVTHVAWDGTDDNGKTVNPKDSYRIQVAAESADDAATVTALTRNRVDSVIRTPNGMRLETSNGMLELDKIRQFY